MAPYQKYPKRHLVWLGQGEKMEVWQEMRSRKGMD